MDPQKIIEGLNFYQAELIDSVLALMNREARSLVVNAIINGSEGCQDFLMRTYQANQIA